jgi:signal transduction histidine kinase
VDLLSRFAQLASIALDNARLHESLQETNAQLREALQAKEEMIQNVSHELRTPLTLIKGYAETLLGGVFGELDERQREAVAIILRKAETLARLVNGLLTLQTFSAEDLRREPVDVNDLLASLGRDWRQPAQEAQVKVEVRLADSPLRVQADADRLREVLDQLVDNALKFRGDGGLVRLEAAGAGKKVRLAVSDDGIGIPPDKLGKVFERFYQVDGSSKRRYGGAGIGLTLARTIVEAHGGQVWAESPGRLGRGTTIVIELPSA